MDTFFSTYLIAWIAACIVAIVLVGTQPAHFEITWPRYRRYLFQPWKLITFGVATAGITLIAPYTGDPTWDYTDALFMSAFTFASAPWSVGILYRAARRQASGGQVFVALCAMLFSASWSYDAYLLWRDGTYPATWLANMVASSILYLLAGMLWNLEWRTGRGVTLGFLEPSWPDPLHTGGFARIAGYALPIMALVSALILSFLRGGWG